MTRVNAVVGALVLSAAVGFFLVSLTHPLVAMTNDHQGQSVFAAPLPGDTRLVGALRLGNDGLLPYTYEVQAQDPLPTDASLEIVRVEDAVTLYSGRLGTDPVALGALAPGQRVTLKLVVTEPAGSDAAPTLIWSARGMAPNLDGTATGWGVAALAGLDALLFAAWLHEMRRSRLRGVRFP
jgi:hypothetical protein